MSIRKWAGILLIVSLAPLLGGAKGEGCNNSSDDVQRKQQETSLAEGTAVVGMPAIKNFRERKILKDVYELRDQEGLITYTYVENLVPTVVKGHSSRGGKFSLFCESIGYPIPAATQFTNPQKQIGAITLPQADPNGLFSPSSAEGSWVICSDPAKKKPGVVYSEPKLATFPFKLELD